MLIGLLQYNRYRRLCRPQPCGYGLIRLDGRPPFSSIVPWNAVGMQIHSGAAGPELHKFYFFLWKNGVAHDVQNLIAIRQGETACMRLMFIPRCFSIRGL
jgi:hypothetical protein